MRLGGKREGGREGCVLSYFVKRNGAMFLLLLVLLPNPNTGSMLDRCPDPDPPLSKITIYTKPEP